MVNKVEVFTDRGAMLSLPLDDISLGYSVQKIDGLAPVQANLVSTSQANLDGEQYQSFRREKRNILLDLGLEPDYTSQTVRGLRDNLYKFFMPGTKARYKFYADNHNPVEIIGHTESFECPLFVKEPVATMSILCFQPDFYEPVEVEISGNTTAGTFMGTINYEGSIDTGAVYTFLIDRAVTTFTVYLQAEGEQVRTMTIVGDFVAGDKVEISTTPRNKYVTLTRGTVVTSILYMLSPYSDWVRFQPGKNFLRVYAEGAAFPYTIRYTNKHGGL